VVGVGEVLDGFEVPILPIFLFEQPPEVSLPEFRESGTGGVVLFGNVELFSKVGHCRYSGIALPHPFCGVINSPWRDTFEQQVVELLRARPAYRRPHRGLDE